MREIGFEHDVVRAQLALVLAFAPRMPLQGNLAPPLAGSGTRLTAARLRARLVDSRRLNPQSIMPAYFVPLPADGGADGWSPTTDDDSNTGAQRFRRIAASWRGRSLLDAQQIEDVIAYLLTLKEPS